MPVPYLKANDPKRYKLKHAAEDGRLLFCRCTLCFRSVWYLATDLVDIKGPDWDPHLPPFKCSKCGKDEFIHVSIRLPQEGDIGRLLIRRPAGIRKTQLWKTVKLGDEVPLPRSSRR